MNGTITLTMIKPEAVKNGNIGNILAKISSGGFELIAMKYLKLTREQAEKFYEVHRERTFYRDLVEFMSSGPIVAAVLKKEDAVEAYRKFIGSTNPKDAAPGTVRVDRAVLRHPARALRRGPARLAVARTGPRPRRA